MYSTRKTPVGCARNARRAIEQDLNLLDDGLFKRVYRCGKVVYKVAKQARRGDREVTNGRRINLIAEAAWSAHLRAEGFRGIPPVTLWLVEGQPVLAMPYYPRSGRNCSAAENDWVRDLREAGLVDLHDGNFGRTRTGITYVIDLAGWGDFPDGVLPRAVIDQCTSSMDENEDDDGYDDEDDDHHDSEWYCDVCDDYHCGCEGCPHEGEWYCADCEDWHEDGDECPREYTPEDECSPTTPPERDPSAAVVHRECRTATRNNAWQCHCILCHNVRG